MFISMLTASTRSRVPFDLEIFVVEQDFFLFFWVHDSNCYSRGMYSAFSFCRWYALNPVSAWFVIKLCQIVSVDLKCEFTKTLIDQAGSSADACEMFLICCSQVFYKQLGIFSAFSGTNLYETFHCTSPIMTGECQRTKDQFWQTNAHRVFRYQDEPFCSPCSEKF
jgi:hypothetical protein